MKHIDEVGRYLIDQTKDGKRKRQHCMITFHDNPHILRNIDEYLIAIQELILQKVNWDGKRHCTKLTSLSIETGKLLLGITGKLYQEDVEELIHLGNFFLEGFYQCGYIEIETPLRGTRDSSQVILTAHWPTTPEKLKGCVSIKAINSKRPLDISSHIQISKFKDGPRFGHRIIKTISKQECIEALEDPNVPVFKAMNKLQQVAWQIDGRILEAVRNNPLAFYNPAKGDDSNTSKEMAYNYTVAKAELLEEEDEFYFVIDADFRGRLYYKESFLNYQSSDLGRGLLRFAEGKEMTEEGFNWLLRHAACSYNQSYHIDEPALKEFSADYIEFLEEEQLKSISVDKMTLADRVLWSEKNLDFILETANGLLIHKDCEKPVGFLAACLEIQECLQAWMKGKKYFSGLPIPVDG